ncbi:hypothetical protein [Pseudomonas sp. BC115LW]|uniref:hypothetical protein n=1 Tax=Pseudomonas sp. BC115LW TaxID=2683267 RepID=UPI001411E284|nr:hypothetical protein [Pseudomonas sp. BC115LW]NBB34167.1 hypothetical protein [Pseudomonas sp. BC115LW]
MSPITELAIWVIGAGVAIKGAHFGWQAIKDYRLKMMHDLALEVRYEGASEATNVMLDRFAPLATLEQREEVVREVLMTIKSNDASVFAARAEAKANGDSEARPGSWT